MGYYLYLFGVVMALFVIFLVSAIVGNVSQKKNKQKLEANKENDLALTEALNQSGQHLKYKPDVKVIVWVNLAIIFLCVLITLFMIFLPIYQVKIELFDETLATKDFSLYENYKALKMEGDYTESTVIGFLILFPALMPLLMILMMMIAIIRRRKVYFDMGHASLNAFKSIQLYNSVSIHDNSSLPYSDWSVGAVILSIAVVFQIAASYAMKNATVLNDMSLCNAVSGYIAIPIICFLVAVALVVVHFYLLKDLKAKIKGEAVELPKTEEDAPQTTEPALPENKEGNAPQVVQATPKDEGKDEPTNEEKKE